MIVAISVACGAAIAWRSDAKTWCRYSVVIPMTSAEVDHADDEPELLIERRRADDVAGLEVLGRVAGIGRRDADDGADAERDRARRRRPSSRARRTAGTSGSASRSSCRRSDSTRMPISPVMRDDTVDEEEAEDDDQHRRQEVSLQRHPRRDREERARAAACRSARRSSGSRARCGADRRAAGRAPKPFRPSRADETMVGMRARQRDQPGREHGAGADVADVRAPDLARRPSPKSGTAGRSPGCWRSWDESAETATGCTRRESTAAAAARATTARRRRTSCPRCAGR